MKYLITHSKTIYRSSLALVGLSLVISVILALRASPLQAQGAAWIPYATGSWEFDSESDPERWQEFATYLGLTHMRIDTSGGAVRLYNISAGEHFPLMFDAECTPDTGPPCNYEGDVYGIGNSADPSPLPARNFDSGNPLHDLSGTWYRNVDWAIETRYAHRCNRPPCGGFGNNFLYAINRDSDDMFSFGGNPASAAGRSFFYGYDGNVEDRIRGLDDNWHTGHVQRIWATWAFRMDGDNSTARSYGASQPSADLRGYRIPTNLNIGNPGGVSSANWADIYNDYVRVFYAVPDAQISGITPTGPSPEGTDITVRVEAGDIRGVGRVIFQINTDPNGGIAGSWITFADLNGGGTQDTTLSATLDCSAYSNLCEDTHLIAVTTYDAFGNARQQWDIETRLQARYTWVRATPTPAPAPYTFNFQTVCASGRSPNGNPLIRYNFSNNVAPVNSVNGSPNANNQTYTLPRNGQFAYYQIQASYNGNNLAPRTVPAGMTSSANWVRLNPATLTPGTYTVQFQLPADSVPCRPPTPTPDVTGYGFSASVRCPAPIFIRNDQDFRLEVVEIPGNTIVYQRTGAPSTFDWNAVFTVIEDGTRLYQVRFYGVTSGNVIPTQAFGSAGGNLDGLTQYGTYFEINPAQLPSGASNLHWFSFLASATEPGCIVPTPTPTNTPRPRVTFDFSLRCESGLIPSEIGGRFTHRILDNRGVTLWNSGPVNEVSANFSIPWSPPQASPLRVIRAFSGNTSDPFWDAYSAPPGFTVSGTRIEYNENSLTPGNSYNIVFEVPNSHPACVNPATPTPIPIPATPTPTPIPPTPTPTLVPPPVYINFDVQAICSAGRTYQGINPITYNFSEDVGGSLSVTPYSGSPDTVFIRGLSLSAGSDYFMTASYQGTMINVNATSAPGVSFGPQQVDFNPAAMDPNLTYQLTWTLPDNAPDCPLPTPVPGTLTPTPTNTPPPPTATLPPIVATPTPTPEYVIETPVITPIAYIDLERSPLGEDPDVVEKGLVLPGIYYPLQVWLDMIPTVGVYEPYRYCINGTCHEADSFPLNYTYLGMSREDGILVPADPPYVIDFVDGAPYDFNREQYLLLFWEFPNIDDGYGITPPLLYYTDQVPGRVDLWYRVRIRYVWNATGTWPDPSGLPCQGPWVPGDPCIFEEEVEFNPTNGTYTIWLVRPVIESVGWD